MLKGASFRCCCCCCCCCYFGGDDAAAAVADGCSLLAYDLVKFEVLVVCVALVM